MKFWMNYHHLYYFMTIAEEGGVSKAATKLRLGQPTLSAQLKQFEENLGVRLFERAHKKLTLSESGVIALDYAKTIFKLGNELYEVLHDQLASARVHLQIGALDSVPKQVTLALTKAAYKAQPCQVTVVEGGMNDMLRMLTAHHVDILVSNYVPLLPHENTLMHRLIVRKPMSIYGASRYAKLKKNFPASLAQQPFILPTYDSKVRYDLEHWFETRHLVIDRVSETQDSALKKLMAIDGLGLIPAASHTVSAQVREKSLCEIGKLTGVYEELYLITANRKIQNPIAKILMESFSI